MSRDWNCDGCGALMNHDGKQAFRVEEKRLRATIEWLLDRFEDIVEDADTLLTQAPEALHPAILGIKCVAENQLGLRTTQARAKP